MKISILLVITFIIIFILVFVYTDYSFEHYTQYSDKKSNFNTVIKTNKNLLIYAYHVKKNSVREIDNLKFLIDHGKIQEFDMILVSNGSEIPFFVPENVKIIKRQNTGYDFEAWYHGLVSIDYKKYEYFTFMNSSVKGPYLPLWHYNTNNHWMNYFTQYIDNKTKLVGTTINYEYSKHIQSMFWVTDIIGLDLILLNKMLPYKNILNMRDTILKYEIGLSKLFLDNNYNIKGIYSRGILDEKHNNISLNNSIHPFDIIFPKNNKINSYKILDYYDKIYSKLKT
jgi:hypothetical protein